MKRYSFVFLLFLSIIHLVASGRIDEIFYQYPNSGINFEALYANPTNGTACVGDFDEDGKPDLIIMGPNYDDFEKYSFVNLIQNKGNNEFVRHNLGLQGLNNGSIAFTKIGDKHFLLALQGGTASPAAANNATAYVAEIRHQNNGFVCTKKQNLDNGLIDGDILFIDFNNDGHADIINFGGGRKVHTYLNNGKNSFSLVTNVTGLTGTVNGKAKVYDVNCDGKPDIVCIDQNSGLCIYLNSGNNAFTQKKISSDYGFKLKPRFEIGDFNNDGHADIVAFDTHTTNASERSVVFFYGSSTGNFTQAPANNFMGVEAAAVAVADFNGDGNLDVLYSGTNNKDTKEEQSGASTLKAYILLGDGNGNFTQHIKSTPQRRNADLFSLCPVGNGEYHVADFDGDGKPDVFVNGELGINIGGKIMRRTELFLSSMEYGFGEPIAEPAVKHKWNGFPYTQVRLEEGRLLDAQNKHLAYIRSLDINRLFASTLAYNLGETGHQPYGGWEANGYGNSFAHYLSAISMAYATTGDPELLQRINRSMEIIIASQDYNGDGFFAFKDGTTWGFDKMARDKIITPYGWDENGNPWGNNDIGFPLYAHHKIFAGIRDAYVYAGHEEARISFLKFCDWLVKWMQNFDTANFQKILLSEHGGFVEILSDAYALSGQEKYLDAAVKFTQENFGEKMSNGIDDLPGRHSNFYCPMALGSAVHYHVSGNTRSRQIARNFFHIVHDHHTLCNGGNGNNERFGTPGLLTYRLGMRGPETCSSYNMLKLAKELFCQEGTTDYLEYYENTMYNHILATLSPRSDGGVCYHTSLKPGTFRIYDDLYNGFWCCVGTGMESHVKYVDAIYFKSDDGLLVNLFTPSTLNWEEKGLKLKMTADFPNNETINIRIQENTSFAGDILIRYPAWAEAKSMKVKVNGSEKQVSASPGELVRISHGWSGGDNIEITIPCKLHLVDLPDDINVSAIFYGPVLLAANFGEVGQPDISSEHAPSEEIKNPAPDPYFPDLKISRKNLAASIQKEPGKMEFKTIGLSTNYTLKPFYDTHHCRYNVYWKIGDDADLEKERLLITDRVLTGVPASETAHNVATTEISNTGTVALNVWGPTYCWFRDANITGSVSYDLNLLPNELPEGENYYIQTTYFGSEPNGFGNFRISVDNTEIAYQGSISLLAPLDFAQRYYQIPRELTKGKQQITVKFYGGRLSLYGLKLTTTDNLIQDKKAFSDATLQSLTVSEGMLSPAFEENKTAYSINVASTVSSINIAAAAKQQGATVSGTGNKTLTPGENTFSIIVTAVDGATTKTYIVTVNRTESSADNDNRLKLLKLSEGELKPAFNANTLLYTADVDYAVNDITILGAPNSEKALVSGDGRKTTLSEGVNTFPITVTAENGAEKTYTLTVNRKAKSADATLRLLATSEGILSPVFSPSILSYSVEIPNTTSSIVLSAVTAHPAARASGHGVQAFLKPGDNIIPIKVTAEDEITERTYNVTIKRTKSSDATLRFLHMFPGHLTPAFNSETTDYTVDVENTVASVVIMATANHSGATIEGDGEKTNLKTGANPFDIKVTAQDGNSKNYYVKVNKEEGTGITGLQNSSLSIYTKEKTLCVSFSGTAKIELASLSGLLIEQLEASNNYSQYLDPGVYILTVNGKSYKIII